MSTYLFDGISLQNKRTSNMDSLLLKTREICNGPCLLAVVCDGVGSTTDGAFASANTVRMLDEWFCALEDVERIGVRLLDNVIKVNAHVAAAAKTNNLDSATTLSAIFLANGAYYIVHVGDSRIYSFDNGFLEILTSDDVSETGKLTACIGRYDKISPHYGEGSIDGRIFLLCSDGVYKKVEAAFIASQMKMNNKREMKKAIKIITDYAILQGERDNISLALIKTES